MSQTNRNIALVYVLKINRLIYSRMGGFAICFFLFVLLPISVHASYVLPYPSFMPGNKLYRVSRFVDEVKRYWHIGNLASYLYYLEQSDKALVEAKTLFEYHQYLLALQALERSNEKLINARTPLQSAKEEGKDIEKYRREFGEAMDEHNRLIAKIKQETPEAFTWTPEKSDSQVLDIHRALLRAERVRREALTSFP